MARSPQADFNIRSLILENKQLTSPVSHTASSIKHHFLLLRGVIRCSTDVIHFTAGPCNSLKFTADRSCGDCISLHPYQCAPLWPRSPVQPQMSHAPLRPRHRQAASCDPAGALAADHDLPSAGFGVHLHSRRTNESYPSCVYFRELLEHETSQQKHTQVFRTVQFMVCSTCVQRLAELGGKNPTWFCLW